MPGTDLYKQIDIEARVESASPHQLIALLYDGLLASLTTARLALETRDLALKARQISRAVAIVNALRDCLDDSVDSDFPHNTRRLYDYMIMRLLQASRQLEVEPISEVTELVLTIKSGWDQISPDKK